MTICGYSDPNIISHKWKKKKETNLENKKDRECSREVEEVDKKERVRKVKMESVLNGEKRGEAAQKNWNSRLPGPSPLLIMCKRENWQGVSEKEQKKTVKCMCNKLQRNREGGVENGRLEDYYKSKTS